LQTPQLTQKQSDDERNISKRFFFVYVIAVRLPDTWFHRIVTGFSLTLAGQLWAPAAAVGVADTKDDSNGCPICKESIMKTKSHQYIIFHFEQSIFH